MFTKNLAVIGDILLVPIMAAEFLGLQITGAWTGTLSIEVSTDGVNFGALGMHNAPDGVITTSYIANGQAYSNDIGGFQAFRVRASAAMTGAAVVTVLAS